MISKKNLGLVFAISILATGCATRQPDQVWERANNSVNIKTTVGYRVDACYVITEITNTTNSHITFAEISYSFFDETGKFTNSASARTGAGIPAGQKVVVSEYLRDSNGSNYYPFRCPKFSKVDLRASGR